VFYTITKFLLIKNRISETEQSQAFIREFQLFEINEAAKHVLHGTSQNSFLQPSIILTAPPTQQASPYIKAEDLLMLFKQMAHGKFHQSTCSARKQAKVDDNYRQLQHQPPSGGIT
jgi:hypothetical protein